MSEEVEQLEGLVGQYGVQAAAMDQVQGLQSQPSSGLSRAQRRP